MNEQLIEEVVAEIRPALAGRHWGKVFQLSGASLAVDFRTDGNRYLLLSAEPNQPRLHFISRTGFSSLSEALDEHFRRLARERAFDARAAAASSRIRQDLARLRKLTANLARDLAAHGDAAEHKRAGDLLLANLANAERRGGT